MVSEVGFKSELNIMRKFGKQLRLRIIITCSTAVGETDGNRNERCIFCILKLFV